MSESTAASRKAAQVSSFAGSAVSDLRMLAQVERWMTMIRQLNREQEPRANIPAIN
jgi:hypothetical protein